MATFLRKKWALVLALGLISVVIGFFLVAYSIAVVGKGPVSVNADSGMIGASFVLGLGMGYIICSYVIRDLERKIS